MKFTDRLNVLIQATTVAQKGGALTLDEAVNAKSAIDVISAGTLNQNYPAAINMLIEIVVNSQKKGVYSLKDAHMIYLAIDGIEAELQNEVNRINGQFIQQEQHVESNNEHIDNLDNHNDECVITVPPKILKKK